MGLIFSFPAPFKPWPLVDWQFWLSHYYSWWFSWNIKLLSAQKLWGETISITPQKKVMNAQEKYYRQTRGATVQVRNHLAKGGAPGEFKYTIDRWTKILANHSHSPAHRTADKDRARAGKAHTSQDRNTWHNIVFPIELHPQSIFATVKFSLVLIK